MLPNSKEETELRSSGQEASLSAGKNRVVLVPCSFMEVHPYSISGSVDISEVPGCRLL